MLVLSRQRDQKIMMPLRPGFVVPPEGLLLEITVVDIRFDKVRLGIEAPKEIPVHREEVYEAILKKGGAM